MFQSKSSIAVLSIVSFVFALTLMLQTLAVAAGPDPDPATAPAKVDPLPPGWKGGQFDTAEIKTGNNSDLEARFELTGDPKTGPGDKAFAEWAKQAKVRQAKYSPMQNRKETELKESKIGGHGKIFEYEITGDLFDQPIHYRIFYVPIRSLYCSLVCWTNPKHWDAAKLEFEKLVTNLK